MHLRDRTIDSPPRPHLAPMKDEFLRGGGKFHVVSEKTEMSGGRKGKRRSQETIFGENSESENTESRRRRSDFPTVTLALYPTPTGPPPAYIYSLLDTRYFSRSTRQSVLGIQMQTP